MNRSEWKERLPLIQAFVEGKTIQVTDKGCNNWTDELEPEFDCFDSLDYRIKPEPKVIWICTESLEVIKSDIILEKHLNDNPTTKCTKYVEVIE